MLYYDLSKGLVDSTGLKTYSDYPRLYQGMNLSLEIKFGTWSNGTITAANLSGVSSWRASVDKDLNSSTSPMCRTTTGIVTTSAATGVLTIPIDTTTSTFASAVNGQAALSATFEICGLDASGKVTFVAQIPVICSALVDPSGTTTPVATGWTAEASDIRSGKKAYGLSGETTGTLVVPDLSDTTAAEEDVESGKVFHKANGSSATGTSTKKDVSQVDASAADVALGKKIVNASGEVVTGTHECTGADVSQVDAAAGDVRSGKKIVNASGEVVTGTLEVLDTSDADAAASDIASGKTAYVNGVKVTGTNTNASQLTQIEEDLLAILGTTANEQ